MFSEMYYYSLVLDWGDESVVKRFQDVIHEEVWLKWCFGFYDN